MSITSALNIAKSAIFAQQAAIQVASNNVANANTEGYIRQKAILNESGSSTSAYGYVGNGVTVSEIKACYDKYLEASVAEQNCSAEEWEVYETYFSRVESILDEDSSNLTSSITDFFDAWESLATDPTSSTALTDVVTSGQNMSQSIREIYEELQDLKEEIDDKVYQSVDDVNDILNSLADINAQTYKSGSQDATLLSERTSLIKQLSGIMDIQYFEDSNGGLTVMTSDGKLLLDKTNASSLSAEKSSDGVYTVNWISASGTKVDITDDVSAGSLKGLIDFRDNQVTSFIDSINDLAVSLADEVNSIHSTGYTASGVTGINFFKSTATTGDYAAVMDISDEVATSTDYVAFTSSADETSGNETALAIAELGSSSVTIDGESTTYTDYCTSVLSEIGNLSENAQNVSEYHQSLLSTVETQRDSVSAVSTDEEMIDLVKFQYAYQAASQLLSTVETMLDSLMEVL